MSPLPGDTSVPVFLLSYEPPGQQTAELGGTWVLPQPAVGPRKLLCRLQVAQGTCGDAGSDVGSGVVAVTLRFPSSVSRSPYGQGQSRRRQTRGFWLPCGVHLLPTGGADGGEGSAHTAGAASSPGPGAHGARALAGYLTGSCELGEPPFSRTRCLTPGSCRGAHSRGAVGRTWR